MKSVRYSVVVPVYNEEEVIEETCRRLTAVMERAGEPYEIIFVNDGSEDGTLQQARALCRADTRVKLLSFSRNFGHQIAITAGMDHAAGDAVVVIDADLQDPPQVILQMIEKWKEGYHVVYGKRKQRKGESAFKKLTAKAFYRILNVLAEVPLPNDAGDFRLLDRRVCEALKTLPEHNRYVRGLVGWVGFSQTGVEYVREERFAGETKYPLRKMLKFAGDGLTSFSYKPLKLSIYLGGFLAAGSFVWLAVLLIRALLGYTGDYVAPLFAGLFFVGGLILIMLGVGGTYIGRIYDEAKKRPLYIVGETIGLDHAENT